MAFDLQSRDLSLYFQSLTEEIKQNFNSTKGPYDSGSDPSSPSGSQLCSVEAVVDEEDEYVAELTRQMANYMLQDDDKNEKPGGVSGSPQSTLWSPFGSGYGSPICPSREPSPPLTPIIEKFEEGRIREDIIIDPVPVMSLKFPKSELRSKQALIDEQIRAVQANFHKIKQEKEREKRERRQQNDAIYRYKGRPLQKQHGTDKQNYINNQLTGSGMRAIILNGSGSRPGSGGTGVFLPRATGNPSESRKQTGCSTVLIPARVVQALKLHFDKMGVASRFNSDFPPQQDALLIGSCDSSHSEKKGLPQEWTY